jgi:hypothetical protein
VALPGEPVAPKTLGVVNWNGEHENDSLVWSRNNAESGANDVVEWKMEDGVRLPEKVRAGLYNYPFVARGDFGGNNFDKLVWRNPANGELSTSGSGPGGTYFDLGSDHKRIPTQDWAIEGVGNFSYDANDDVVWRHTNGQVAIAYMDGSHRIATTYPGGPDPSRSWKIQSIGDFDGDWVDDILWRHKDGALAIWFAGSNLTTGYPTYHNLPGRHAGLEWTVVATPDDDQDGKDDIYWRRNDGALAIWRMNGARMVAYFYPGSIDPQWKVVGILHTTVKG